jgi:hypothetical protein
MPGLRDYASWPLFTTRSTKMGMAGGVAAGGFGMASPKRLPFGAHRFQASYKSAPKNAYRSIAILLQSFR